ncbi:pentatricopeptide repeat-containing protein [Senna tora]|uniref:Pentatricopeptide repeat-containing protein n=1 Tax=Senna tora TaxID=362788 RepID=A0A834TYU6_9FABA|nr:pentatricopeptide repeat-containing protein [Senna tora]
MVARLTPDQKVACSIHVGFNIPIFGNFYEEDSSANCFVPYGF